MSNTITPNTTGLVSVTANNTRGTLHGLSNRSKSKLRASTEAIVVKNSNTKYTYVEFKPAPDSPVLNATMTERYLGLELGYRK